jgi:hypothetical protein
MRSRCVSSTTCCAPPSARLLAAVTARREELEEGHPLTGLTTALQALGGFTEIGLGRLGREETALLAERITGTPLDAAELGRLFACACVATPIIMNHRAASALPGTESIGGMRQWTASTMRGAAPKTVSATPQSTKPAAR